MHDLLSQTCRERDELRTWVCKIAVRMGVSMDDFKSRDLHGQWMELCERIEAELPNRETEAVTQLRVRFDGILRKMILGTFALCAVLLFVGWLINLFR